VNAAEQGRDGPGRPDTLNTLGALLRRHRVAAGLSQEELAQRSGLSVRAISNIERGLTASPYSRSVRMLAEALALPDQQARELLRQSARSRTDGEGPDSAAGPPGGRPPGPPVIVPRQLPAPAADFVGREGDLKELSALLDGAAAAGAVMISVIAGTAGVGKTALALRWAHQVADRFPDGQLFADLRGYGPSGSPRAPADALFGFLEALGVPAAQVPEQADSRAGLYRSLLAGRRVLVLLDNAADAGQVRPLLPASPGCLALITSRGQLTGLAVAERARLVSLDVLSQAEARKLLAQRLGPLRLAGEPQAADLLIDLTARLPLALAIVAARAELHPAFSLGTLAAELRDVRQRLQMLDGGDASADVRAALSWSCHRLSEDALATFRLLSVHPGPDVTVPAAASLAGVAPAAARKALAELISSGLLAETAPGRYACHDLTRIYAGEQSRARDTPADRPAARDRMLDHYTHTAHAAALLIKAEPVPLTLAARSPEVRPESLANAAQAMEWFAAEHRVLLAVTAEAERTGSDTHAWMLPTIVSVYLNRAGYWHEWAATQHGALAAARRLGDRHAQAHVHRCLGQALIMVRQPQDARTHLEAALRLFDELGDPAGQAKTHATLANLHCNQQRPRAALDHTSVALRLYQAAGNRLGQAISLGNIGWNHVELGDPQQAIGFCEQALAMCTGTGGHTLSGAIWDTIGLARHELGQDDEAVRCYHRAISDYRQLGDRPGEAATLTRLGQAHYSRADMNAAEDSWRRALEILSELRLPDADVVLEKLGQLGRR
jgi:tetratricopeptide (TPR) repeat protein/DNA-binding XRE family transcriptional regulator